MKAVLTREPGNADQLFIGEAETPVPGDDELLIRVHATSLNRADILQREGKYPPPEGASSILGLDVAGIVEDTGKNCTGWQKGERVFGLLPGGGYAEYAVIHHKGAMKIPSSLEFVEAAAIPEVFLTAFQALFRIGDLGKGQTVLIHAGASGVGTAAIQLARERNAGIIVTAGSPEKLNACLELGAQSAINYKEGKFVHAALNATQGKGVDLIIDFIGRNYWGQNLSVLKTDGSMVILALMSGSLIQNFDLRIFMKKRLHITGSTLRNRSIEYKNRLTRDFSDFALDKLSRGQLKPVIDKIFSWEEVRRAHRYMEENRNTGKIVLKIPE